MLLSMISQSHKIFSLGTNKKTPTRFDLCRLSSGSVNLNKQHCTKLHSTEQHIIYIYAYLNRPSEDDLHRSKCVFKYLYGLKGYGKCHPNGIRSPDRPARSQSLYRQSYAGLQLFSVYIFVAESHNEDCCAIKIRELIDLSNAIASPTKAVLRKIDNVMLTKIQPDASVCRNLFTAESLYMFRVSQQSS
jgi:hypothetical protein